MHGQSRFQFVQVEYERVEQKVVKQLVPTQVQYTEYQLVRHRGRRPVARTVTKYYERQTITEWEPVQVSPPKLYVQHQTKYIHLPQHLRGMPAGQIRSPSWADLSQSRSPYFQRPFSKDTKPAANSSQRRKELARLQPQPIIKPFQRPTPPPKYAPTKPVYFYNPAMAVQTNQHITANNINYSLTQLNTNPPSKNITVSTPANNTQALRDQVKTSVQPLQPKEPSPKKESSHEGPLQAIYQFYHPETGLSLKAEGASLSLSSYFGAKNQHFSVRGIDSQWYNIFVDITNRAIVLKQGDVQVEFLARQVPAAQWRILEAGQGQVRLACRCWPGLSLQPGQRGLRMGETGVNFSDVWNIIQVGN